MQAPRHTRLQDFRIGYIVDDLIAPISSEVRTRYESLISALTKAGATLKPGWPSGIEVRAAAFFHDHSQPIDKRVLKSPESPRPYVQNISYWISIASLSGAERRSSLLHFCQN